MIHYLLDTDTLISLFRGSRSVAEKVARAGDPRIATTAVNLAELYYGAYRSQKVSENLRLIDQFRTAAHVFDFDERVAVVFGEVKARLARTGALVGDSDLLIAAVALCTGSVLVTNDTRHFERIEGLALENWVAG